MKQEEKKLASTHSKEVLNLNNESLFPTNKSRNKQSLELQHIWNKSDRPVHNPLNFSSQIQESDMIIQNLATMQEQTQHMLQKMMQGSSEEMKNEIM